MSTKLAEDPRETLNDLVTVIRAQVGDNLLGLYLFGSLATGGFYPGHSDLDLIAVLEHDVDDRELDSLRIAHDRFERSHPAWRGRVDVLYIGRAVLATFASEPRGRVAHVHPREELRHRDVDGDPSWLLDWHAVLTADEPLAGPRPRELGPDVPRDRFRWAVVAQLRALHESVRDPSVAYVPVTQGYIAATVCRALYSLATGEQASKEHAISWMAERRPEAAEHLWAVYKAYRADPHTAHQRLIGFVDAALIEAESSADPIV